MESYVTIDKMSDLELIALVLGMRPSDDGVVRLAGVMANDTYLGGGCLGNVARECAYVGSRRVARLEASVELGRRTLARQARHGAPTISTPEDVVRLMEPLYAGQSREIFYAAALTTKNRLIRLIEVSVGSLNASIVHPRELYREAVAVSAASIVVVHNHPSGDPTPSGADLQLTRRLSRAGEVVGIELIDHVVVGHASHASLREMGVL